MSYRKRLIIIGAGGYAKSVVDSLDHTRYRIYGFIDERSDKTEHLGYDVVAHDISEVKDARSYCYFIAIGSNPNRCAWFRRLDVMGLEIISVVDRTALFSSMSQMGRGCFIGKMAVVNAGSRIGDDVIVNTMSLIEHGCHVASHVNISTKAVVNGDVRVGEGSFIGSGSAVIGQLTVGEWSIVGAGAIVTKDVGSHVTVAGVPARVVRNEARFW